MTVPLPAAVRGVVVDEENQPVQSTWSLFFHNGEGGWGHGDPDNGRFGTYGVAPAPLRIKVRAEGFDDYESEEIPLEPGEMRFVKIVMHRRT